MPPLLAAASAKVSASVKPQAPSAPCAGTRVAVIFAVVFVFVIVVAVAVVVVAIAVVIGGGGGGGDWFL